MPIPSEIPKAVNQYSLRTCSELIPKSGGGGGNPFVSFFRIGKVSSVFLPVPSEHYLFLFSTEGTFSFSAVKAVRIRILAQTFFFGLPHFCPRFFVLYKCFATAGVRSQEDYCLFDLKSNALTTRP